MIIHAIIGFLIATCIYGVISVIKKWARNKTRNMQAKK